MGPTQTQVRESPPTAPEKWPTNSADESDQRESVGAMEQVPLLSVRRMLSLGRPPLTAILGGLLFSAIGCAPRDTVIRDVRLEYSVPNTEACASGPYSDGEIRSSRVALNLRTGTLGIMFSDPSWEAPGNWYHGCQVVDRDHWTCSDQHQTVRAWEGRLAISSGCYSATEIR